MKISDYLEELSSAGRYHFTLNELENKLGLSKSSIRVTLFRLKKSGKIASPARGYYIIIPPEYRSLGCLPPDHFIPHMMQFLNVPYYTGLLSAAMFYGAAHQQPQVFQVMAPRAQRDTTIGLVHVSFHINKYINQCPVKKFNTPMSELLVSTPEVTALDLVTYSESSGGLSNVMTVLSELVESMNVKDFKKALSIKREKAALQRLGYLLELLGQESYAKCVEQHLRGVRFGTVALAPGVPANQGEISKRWNLIINQQLESDL